MNLADLPTEMVRCILSCIWPEDLFCVLTTCRSLHDIALPLLHACPFYGNLTMREKKHRPSYLGPLGNRPLEYQSFVGAISRRPELGSHIRTLDLSDHRSMEWNSENSQSLNTRDAKTLARRACEISQMHDTDWFSILTRRIPFTNFMYIHQYRQAFILLLLSYCHGLESLLVNDLQCFQCTRLGNYQVSSAFGLTLATLSNLRVFKIGCGSRSAESGCGWNYPSALFECVFTLPNVEKLSMCLFKPMGMRKRRP